MAVQKHSLPSFFDATTEAQLVRVASDLGAREVGGPLSPGEEELLGQELEAPPLIGESLATIRRAILGGADPLGEMLRELRAPTVRRALGAFYTPPELAHSMVEWVLSQRPDRVVDAGCGSGRFASAVVRKRRDVEIVAVDIDPLATLMTRAVLAVLGHERASVLQADYTAMDLPRIEGRTAFIGNPPYVRHHSLSPSQKLRAQGRAQQLGYRMSALAGLHAHFYLATPLHARHGDVGCFVTSSEWLDVGYGAIVRDLLLNELGGQSLHVLEPTAVPFVDAMTTAVIACFVVGSQPESVRLSAVADARALDHLHGGRPIPRAALVDATRWSQLLRPSRHNGEEGFIALRDIARVHRGLVTGANEFFVMTRERAQELGIETWCRPAITRAIEILTAQGAVRDGSDRRVLLDISEDVDRTAYPSLDAYLRLGELPRNGRPPVCEGYICRHRRPWWRVGTQRPPPIVASYMARQAPAFALNPDRLALINIGHGLYPNHSIDQKALHALVDALNQDRERHRGAGRTYHGGMEKFEPGELESLLIPADGPWR